MVLVWKRWTGSPRQIPVLVQTPEALTLRSIRLTQAQNSHSGASCPLCCPAERAKAMLYPLPSRLLLHREILRLHQRFWEAAAPSSFRPSPMNHPAGANHTLNAREDPDPASLDWGVPYRGPQKTAQQHWQRPKDYTEAILAVRATEADKCVIQGTSQPAFPKELSPPHPPLALPEATEQPYLLPCGSKKHLNRPISDQPMKSLASLFFILPHTPSTIMKWLRRPPWAGQPPKELWSHPFSPQTLTGTLLLHGYTDLQHPGNQYASPLGFHRCPCSHMVHGRWHAHHTYFRHNMPRTNSKPSPSKGARNQLAVQP